ncbi:uncharacterized protein [Triticum aestivum]|uniref:uncharacterized protein n=1 Tax=Triticum aestivum TaxID=4565 RepID=UPI001D01B9BA|nr:uncharacterized protein LOC123084477 [Triticum aestivum]
MAPPVCARHTAAATSSTVAASTAGLRTATALPALPRALPTSLLLRRPYRPVNGVPPAPVYAEVPRLLLNLVFLLDHLPRLSSWLLCLVGTGTDDDLSFHYSTASRHHQERHHEDHCLKELEEHALAVRFDVLSASVAGDDSPLLPEGCAVSLADFHGAACVRRPQGCFHVFHRGCLGRWAAHGHGTCPQCRAPFLPPFLRPWPLRGTKHKQLPATSCLVAVRDAYSSLSYIIMQS